jgi:hypothetical protein
VAVGPAAHSGTSAKLGAFGHDPPDAAQRVWNIAVVTGNDVNVGMGYRLAGSGPVIKPDVEAIKPEVFLAAGDEPGQQIPTGPSALRYKAVLSN